MLVFTFHLRWNVLGTTPFLWSDIPTRIPGCKICSSLSWPLWPHLTPQHGPLLLGGSVSSVGESWEEVLSMPSFHHSSLPPLLAHRGCILVCSLPTGELTRLPAPTVAGLRVSETDSRQSLAAAHLRHSFQWASSVTELRLSPAFCFSVRFPSGEGTQGCDLVAAATARHPGTCDELLQASQCLPCPNPGTQGGGQLLWITCNWGEHTPPLMRCQSGLQPPTLLLCREMHHYLIFRTPDRIQWLSNGG